MMKSVLPFSEKIIAQLACPSCGASLHREEERFCCTDHTCNGIFPIIDRIPFLIDEIKSNISANSIISARGSKPVRKNVLKQLMRTITPRRSLNFTSEKNYNKLVESLEAEFADPHVLIIGGAVLGTGIKPLVESKTITLLETDVYIGPRTQLLCDGQALPFQDHFFHAVVIQAVLEFIIDTERCVEEIKRVLVDGGYVYSEMPFMQQDVGFYDMKRLTNSGHRFLFRYFREVDSGPVAGAGTVLYWAWESFLCGFSDNPFIQAILRRLARFSGFWIKYFDYYLMKKKASLSSASGYYFLGQKCRDFIDGSKFSFHGGAID